MPPEDQAPTFELLKSDGRYMSADNLRFTCILAIIAVHSSKVLTMDGSQSSAIELFQFAMVTVLKFGTIGFFLISGFLLEKNLHSRSSIELMTRRIRKVLVPWTFWFVLSTLALSASDFIHHKRAFQAETPLLTSLWKTCSVTFTGTSFWFVPNLLLSLIVLLIFRRYLQSLLFGALLLSVTLFYSANIYTQWFEPHHTRAFFGFIFYLWLGHYAAVNVDRFTRLLQKIPGKLLWGMTSLSVAAEFAEGRWLLHNGAVDPLNTLKISTQIFSVLVFLCFFKMQRRIWPVSFDVQRTTFGMYLSHVITLAALTSPAWILLHRPGTHPFLDSLAGRTTIWLVTSSFAVIFSFAIARALSASPWLGWMVGSPRRTPRVREISIEATVAATPLVA